MGPQLYYLNGGERRYGDTAVPVYARTHWEFQAVVAGRIAPVRTSGPGVPRAATLWVFAAGLPHGWAGDGRKPAEIVVFHLPPPDPVLQRFVAEGGGMLEVPLTKTDMIWLRQQADELRPEWARPSEITPLRVARLLNGLTLLALERCAYQPRTVSADPDTERVQRALYWHRQNLHQNPGVERVAAAVGVSEVHLRRLFRKALGESPKAAFQRTRMESARSQIEAGHGKVEQVALLHAYADASSFTRAYRAFFGHPPRGARAR